MHRSPAGCVFTLTVTGQGPVIVDVIRYEHGTPAHYWRHRSAGHHYLDACGR